MSELEQSESGGISRRTVTKAMAWAVPVVAVAAPAPAFAAASQGTVTLTGRACKIPGSGSNWAYIFEVTVTNTTQQTVDISLDSLLIQGGGTNKTSTNLCPDPLTVSAGSGTTTRVITANGFDANDSRNGSAVLTYTIGDETFSTQPTAFSAPPEQGAQCPITAECIPT